MSEDYEKNGQKYMTDLIKFILNVSTSYIHTTVVYLTLMLNYEIISNIILDFDEI